MHDFWQITSGHVHPLLIIELLQIKGKERSAKFEMSNGNGDLDGSKVQM
jgi:hypothetical protein